ncbi:MAG: tetratricopeptide repeat protein [Pseudomonadota bacterium]
MYYDKQDNPLSGASGEAAGRFDEALAAFNVYRGDPMSLLDEAVAASPEFAMAHILKAYLLALSTEPEAVAEAKQLCDRLSTMRLDEREASHAQALALLVRGDWSAAATALDRHTMRWPRDMTALQCGHLMDFYRANARDMRDRIARALPHWTEETPGYSIVLGMYAFGLEESGDYARAEDAGRRAVALEPLDCWAHHAVAHVMEMQGRAEDGIGWMAAREPHWSGDDNFFRVHNWWHRALFHLDLGQNDQALALYDGPVREDRSDVALDLVDASALLWRLSMAGCDVRDRWAEVADAWDKHADGRLYPFNDWHAAMAYLGAGREADVERLITSLSSADGSETASWARQTGAPLITGFTAFWRGDYALAAETLHAARFIANGFGGSHAQRDVIDWTLTEAALRGGLRDVAFALASERLSLKPHSPVNRRFLNRSRGTSPTSQAAA